jgi:beta-glucosidase/6-phospho-beta-glucosidase/beta-galactosidase
MARQENRAWFEQDRIHFAVGIEDTFVPQTRPGERRLDEYELTQHYERWHADLGLAVEAGATMVRWGIPWHRVNPGSDTWEWAWLDQVVDRFVELGLEPIVDLMHYGTPLWLAGEFAHPDYPARVAEYAARVAERYRGALNVFTPLNEPLLNIMYCGEFAYWPPYLSGDDGFVQLLRAISRGIVETQRAVAAASGGQASFVHVEASFRFVGDDPARAGQVEHLRERAFLVQDLVTGLVGPAHPLVSYLSKHGFADDDFSWAQEHTAMPDVMGVNYYPAHSTEHFAPGMAPAGGPLDPRPRVNGWTDGLEDVLTQFAERYGRPVFLTETAWTGPTEDRVAWLDASVASVRKLRARGVEVVGYTWWPLFDMVEWTYRHGIEPATDYQLAMGLWDLVPDDAGVLQRVRNAVADRFRQHARRD